MKLTGSILGALAFVIIGIAFVGSNFGLSLLMWLGSAICIACALALHRQREEDHMLKMNDEEKRIYSRETNTPIHLTKIKRGLKSGEYCYYDDDGVDITDMFFAGLIIHDLMVDYYTEEEIFNTDVSLYDEVDDSEAVTLTSEIEPEFNSSSRDLEQLREQVLATTTSEPEYVSPSETIAPESKSENFSTGFEEPEPERYSSPEPSSYSAPEPSYSAPEPSSSYSSSSYDSGGGSDFGGGSDD